MKTWLAILLGALLAVIQNVDASRSIPVRIDGTDTYCTSYVVTVDSGTAVYTCSGAPPPAGAPTNCTARVNSSTVANFPSSGGTANLTVACDQTSGILYNWSRNGTFGASTLASWADVLPSNGGGSAVNYTYQVRACNGAACVTVPSSALTATVSAAGGFSGSCPGFTNTVIVTMNWASPTRQYATLGANDMAIVQFTTGNVSTTTSLVRIAGAEYNSSPSSRIATLSTTQCDFSTQSAPGANMIGNSITASFAIGTGTGYGYYPVLSTNTTYYLNVKNSPNSTCATTTSGVCNMFFDLLKPGGL